MIKNGMLFVKDGVLVQVQELTTGLFCLFEILPDGNTRTLVQDANESNKWQYVAEELPARLEGWQPMKGPELTKDEQIATDVKAKVKKGKI